VSDAPESKSSVDYPVILINRDCDAHRLEAFQKRAARFGMAFQRLPAINCAAQGFDFTPYENEIGPAFYGRSLFLKGAVGCFLSHVRAWQQVISGGCEMGVICEDDAWVIGPPPLEVADLELPPDADLIFVNQRMAGGLLQAKYVEALKNKNLLHVPANTALCELLKINPHITGPGGDGYVLTRSGAEKLLRMIVETKISMEVDWFLLFNSLSDGEMQQFLAVDGTGRFGSVLLARERLTSYVMLPSLVEQASLGSGINFDKPGSYIERSVMFPNL
jgi:GR25 family glycosyltransferase involved in LPS biosynthesis